ncbi:MAG: UDP-N-acetylmuramate dehydrogenase [Candidatus Omnitrophota bacterium]
MMKGSVFDTIKGRIKRKEPLAKHTTFRIGGPAQFFIEPRGLKDLKALVAWARIQKIPVLLMGRGSNILASDRGVEAVVVKFNAPFFKKASISGNLLTVNSGLSLGRLVQLAKNHSLSGAEFLAGIPGTVGGALAMNAGAWGQALGNLVEKVKVMNYNGKIKVLNKKQIRFGYRKSSLAKYIILSARLRLHKKSKKEINGLIKRYLALRKNTQDSLAPNAGCIFRNPPGYTAGRLIDLCGLKGKESGGAVVSKRHANFILNLRSARCSDVLKLMNIMKKKVKRKFDINLEPEIRIWR